jgi:urease accessory protein
MTRVSALATTGLTTGLVLLPQAGLAHPGHGRVGQGEMDGLVDGSLQSALQGFLHPFGGADHVLAMVAVGLLAALYGGRALWALPLAFLAMMTLGAGLGLAGLVPLHAEIGIGLSVVAFGLALALRVEAPLAALMALVGGFAVFHGLAHGAERPETATVLGYGAGFLAATAALHCAGIGLGRLTGARPVAVPVLARLLGGALTVAGLTILAQGA